MADVTYPTHLLPCPFCGARAQQRPWHGGAPTKVMIGCSEFNGVCDVGPQVTGETPKEAAAHWNHRPAPLPQAAASERFPVFDSTAAWGALPAEAMELIGAVAIDLVAARQAVWRMVEDGEHYPDRRQQLTRAASAAERLADDLLRQHVVEAIGEDALVDETGFPRLPATLGPVCRSCGCTQLDACQPFSCSWVEPDLCSACVPAAGEGRADG